jgi:hypothetical protein
MAMTNGYLDLMVLERDAYPDPSSVEPVALAFVPPPFGQAGNRLQLLPQMLDKNDDLVQGWTEVAPEILEGIRSLIVNFPSSGSSFTRSEIREFVWLVVFQQLALHESLAGFVRRELDSGRAVDTDAFPSLKAMAYTVFYKFYADPDRRASNSDVLDMLIASALPYVEAFITENHQAETIRKVQHHGFLGAVQTFRLKDLREGMPSRRSSRPAASVRPR